MFEQKEVKIQFMKKLASCLKKPVEPQYSSSSRKNQEHRNIAPLSLQLCCYNNLERLIL